MVVTFSNKQRELALAVITNIHGNPVEIVAKYKYLGTIFDNLLKFASNTEEIFSKSRQRDSIHGGDTADRVISAGGITLQGQWTKYFHSRVVGFYTLSTLGDFLFLKLPV
ncbi:hypothetical protein PFLUV_G00116550 [Perca fluviatilis]|uniref:Uncharacterized protein n=1 Tax=Perca fluviatilis TaxID=8168 RepID=A0A6A5F1Z4_PERFL|nr:hypothetical protein PFLUV_G00116550 [Perca fluviatilis]